MSKALSLKHNLLSVKNRMQGILLLTGLGYGVVAGFAIGGLIGGFFMLQMLLWYHRSSPDIAGVLIVSIIGALGAGAVGAIPGAILGWLLNVFVFRAVPRSRQK